MNQPLVSVLMPCYNVEAFVEDSLNSILNQTYRNIEVIAINDCSQDSTSEILHRMAQHDLRIKVIDNEINLKLIDTLNKGITLCKGDYIARMDADDIALPTRIEKEVTFLEEHPDHDIVSCWFTTFPTENPQKQSLYRNPLHHDELRAYMLFNSGICHPAVMIRKRLFTERGLSFEKQYLHVEDYALWSEAIYLTKLANISESLLLYRIHKSQVSSMYEELQKENKKKVFEIHCHRLNIPVSDKLLDIYSSVAEAVPAESSFTYLDKCEEFMLSLLHIQETNPFCNEPFLRKMLSLHWLRLCANSRLGMKVLKKMKQSSLYNDHYYSVRDKLVLYIKCIFKLRYKKSFIYKIVFW